MTTHYVDSILGGHDFDNDTAMCEALRIVDRNLHMWTACEQTDASNPDQLVTFEN